MPTANHTDFEMSKKLPSLFQEYIHLSRYSRWLPEQNRRETWQETIKRYFDFFEKHLKENCSYALQSKDRHVLENAILQLDVMPSMRCIMTAGPALERDQIAGFNCSYIAIDSPRAFDEIMYILTRGTGVGFSVERQHITCLPVVADEFHESDTTIAVADSAIGWAKATKELVSLLYTGQIPKWDMSKIRPKGAPLKVFGGRASGPDPLDELFRFMVKTFKGAAGRKLQSIECHDIVCKIADTIVCGGVRRSALISLSNLSDDRMRTAKSGNWWEVDPQRALANNSAVYTEKPDVTVFMAEWKSLYDSKSGERGIFSRKAAKKQVEKSGRRDTNFDFGVNPCAEILLRSMGLCNLSECIIRAWDTKETLLEKVKLATILGTFQSTLTKYRYLRKEWQTNSEEERLLGVSLTGIMDHPLMNTPTEELQVFLEELKAVAIETNKEWAAILGINPSTAITCIKPSGTVSSLVDSASGIHSRHSQYYIRTVRQDVKDPLCEMMKALGFPNEPDVTKPAHTTVFSFPVKAPENCVTRKDLTAIEHLNLWLMYKQHWAEHTVSITVSVREHEWFDVAAWVWKNFDEVTGISFLPYSEHIYKQAPFQECTEAQYEELLAKMPTNVDWEQLSNYELTDSTTSTKDLACTAGACDIL